MPASSAHGPADAPAASAAAGFGMAVTLEVSYAEAVQRTREALNGQGFGILSEIDVTATLHAKLGVDVPPQVILGACNPPLAHQALTAEIAIGLLLPCNVVVYAGDDPGTSVVAILDPVVQLGVTGREDIRPLATEVQARLLRVLNAITARPTQ